MKLVTKLTQKLQTTLYILPALRFVWQGSPRWTLARVVLLTLQSILPLAAIYLTKLVIDAIADSLTAADKSVAFNQVIFWLILTGVVTLATSLVNSLAELANAAQSQRVTDYMQTILHAKSIEADLEYYENSRYYDALQRAQQEASYRPNQILYRLVQLGQGGITLVAVVGLLLALYWGLAGILLVAALPAMLVRFKFARVMYDWRRRRTAMERQAMYLGYMMTTDVHAKELRLFGLGSLFRDRFRGLREKIYDENLAIITRQSMASLVAEAFASVVTFGVYGYIAYQSVWGGLQIGDLVLYHQALQRGQSALKSFLVGISGLYEDNLFLANLYEFLDLKPAIVEPSQPSPIPQPMRQGIVFDRVNFSYVNSDRQALKDISLTLAPGETIALVGENGSGKTTLIKLLCRLYDPTAGKITIDGIDLKAVSKEDLRRQISVIFQDYVKYHFSAQENIWLGNVDLPLTDERVLAAAKRSGADAVIQRLPRGYDTILGKMFDQGEELSVGQWQKVALARAFLRESQVIVLDEPTSAMDPKAEYEIFRQFRELIEGQAAILISHRLSTVKMADRIYVMDQGSIIEHGTHEQLIALQGTYAHLFETQAQNYR